MFQIDLKSRRSIQEQITDNIRELVVTGILKKDQKIPSVRELSKMLSVNPNTVQKAYMKLEDSGFIYTVKGKGSYIADTDRNVRNQLEVERQFDIVRQCIDRLIYEGLDVSEVKERIEEMIIARGDNL